MGTRPTVNPVALSDSLINEDEQDSDNETLISIFIAICLQLHRYLSQIDSVFIAVVNVPFSKRSIDLALSNVNANRSFLDRFK